MSISPNAIRRPSHCLHCYSLVSVQFRGRTIPLCAQCVVLGAIVVGLSCLSCLSCFSLSRQGVDWRESCLCCFFLINNSCCFRCSVRSYIVPFFLSPLNFCFGLPMRPRIFPTQTKNTPELTIIDNSIDNNCL